MSEILVTGGAGFGSHLCEAVLRMGHHVTALGNLDDFYDPQIKRRNLTKASAIQLFTRIEGDVRCIGMRPR